MKRITHANGVITYSFDLLAGFPVSAHVSTRHGGVSPAPWDSLNFSVRRGDEPERVSTNRARLAEALHLDAARVVTCRQVHGVTTVAVAESDAGCLQEGADGLATVAAELPLSLVFADCVPVVLYDPGNHALGVCHAGWRGTVQGAAVAALEAMVSAFGTCPAEVIAGIGPSIGPASYEVGDEVLTAARQSAYGADRHVLYPDGSGRPHFDLWSANAEQLLQAGVPARQIEVSGLDTATNLQDFFSHRAERGQCGLFSMVAWLHPR